MYIYIYMYVYIYSMYVYIYMYMYMYVYIYILGIASNTFSLGFVSPSLWVLYPFNFGVLYTLNWGFVSP